MRSVHVQLHAMPPLFVESFGWFFHTRWILDQLSEGGRQLQPASSTWFVAEAGEMRLMSGLRGFSGPEIVNVEGLAPRIDSPAFSLMAWVQLRKGTGTNVIRKPLGQVPNEEKLSCWGWYV